MVFLQFQKNYPKTASYLGELWLPGTQFLGCPIGILGGAMTWVSEPQLVSAISNAGGFGVLASGAMPPESLSQMIQETKLKTSKPFGVNLILMHPQLSEMYDVCVEHCVSHVVFAGGMPSSTVLNFFAQKGIKTIAFAPTLSIAKRLQRAGVGALIIEGHEAGGHVGPISTSVLVQEILPFIRDIPVFVAGGIGRGEMILKYLEMGAAGCQLGTRFVCASECIAHDAFKKAFIRASARDATLSVQLDNRFPVIPVRSLHNEGGETFLREQRRVIQEVDAGNLTQKEGQLQIEHFWSGALRRAVIEGDVETGSLMAGQSVGFVDAIQPVSEIINTLLLQMVPSALETEESCVA
jgi:enoyl-[acyl-carrier protein] reductase II